MGVSLELGRLKIWFQKEKRDLPWRESPTPYQVWVSEVMLQQTQVSVVISYYYKWMKAFPSIEALADAPLEDVIKVWEGLGYYSRARRLQLGAKKIVEKFGGEIPEDEESLKSIPGIGKYTAGAILSFAFHKKQAAVDGNVIRVLTRIFNIHENISKQKTVSTLFELATSLLPDDEPWIIMEALIELGATVCKKKPECKKCPLIRNCRAFQQDTKLELPVKNESQKNIHIKRVVWVIFSGDEVLLKKESDSNKIMADLNEFPYEEKQSKIKFIELFDKHLLIKIKTLDKVKHSFTKYSCELHPTLYVLKEKISEEKISFENYRWVKKNQLSKLPFSAGHKKIALQIEKELNCLLS